MVPSCPAVFFELPADYKLGQCDQFSCRRTDAELTVAMQFG